MFSHLNRKEQLIKEHQFLLRSLQIKVPTFHYVTQEVKVGNKWEFVDLKLKISFCFILV